MTREIIQCNDIDVAYEICIDFRRKVSELTNLLRILHFHWLDTLLARKMLDH